MYGEYLHVFIFAAKTNKFRAKNVKINVARIFPLFDNNWCFVIVTDGILM